MRLLQAAVAGSVVGALAGLAWFLIILLMPSDVPDNVDGGVGLPVILLFIAAVFAGVGGIAGCVLGVAAESIYHLAKRNVGNANLSKGRGLKSGKSHQPFDELLG